ncbi:Zinc finger, CCHC-type [Senna tora]|uniref:Zinc finger, CCHC-type n=1 Tax=Senna tora TaxID=362788 RepID=A0A834XBP2_9FABA|nr:Zinc finger, CCHC-type [Senna tora]
MSMKRRMSGPLEHHRGGEIEKSDMKGGSVFSESNEKEMLLTVTQVQLNFLYPHFKDYDYDGKWEIETEGEGDNDSMPSLEDDSEVEHAVTGKSLVILRALHTQIREGSDDFQRENIFYTHCHVKDRVYGLIIDGGICVNVASKLMADKLGLRTLKHPRPYRLQWLNESGDLKQAAYCLVGLGNLIEELQMMVSKTDITSAWMGEALHLCHYHLNK